MGNDKRVRKPEWLKISIEPMNAIPRPNALSNRTACTPSVAVGVAPTWANAGEKGQLRS